ncbi:hypothetical protein C8R43DRAFT_1116061 [Mycena crocata]|nr:hypothetical protein C8R43DRAFT_1116061 [Mycena crocata]
MGDTKRNRWRFLVASALTALFLTIRFPFSSKNATKISVPAQCRALHTSLEPSVDFIASRTTSGSDHCHSRNGTEVVFGDLLLDKGVVMGVGYIPNALTSTLSNLQVIDAGGKWISPGIVDAHSHLGVYSAPELNGASDGNSHKSPILPWLRSIDGLNTHDDAYRLAIAGGVTTAQILPGSANNIGGQAFLIKLRPTAERSVQAMLFEPPLTLGLNSSDGRPKWRHMKHACGENPSRTYGQTRMDSAWAFRRAYDEARKIRDAQDAFCDKAERGLRVWDKDTDGKGAFLSNEFKFPIASIHHAGETYLVPNLLKKACVHLIIHTDNNDLIAFIQVRCPGTQR